MSKKDSDESQFRFERSSEPKPFVPAGESEGEAVCFDIHGQWTPSQDRCAAKCVQGQRGPRHYVKWCMDGPDKGHLLNPYSVYYREGDDIRVEQRRGRARYEFRLVSAAAFNHYIRFLQTRTYIHCQAAEREILNV